MLLSSLIAPINKWWSSGPTDSQIGFLRLTPSQKALLGPRFSYLLFKFHFSLLISSFHAACRIFYSCLTEYSGAVFLFSEGSLCLAQITSRILPLSQVGILLAFLLPFCSERCMPFRIRIPLRATCTTGSGDFFNSFFSFKCSVLQVQMSQMYSFLVPSLPQGS